MQARNVTNPPDLDALYAAALELLAQPAVVQFSDRKVQYQTPADLYASLNLIRMEQARAAGASATGVFVAVHDRGLGPGRSFPE